MPGLDTLFQSQEESRLALEGIDNPYDLNFSYNFTFEDSSRSSGATSSNVGFQNSQLILTSGTSGTFVSTTKLTASDVTKVQVKAIGEDLPNVSFRVSADGGNSWLSVTLGVLHSLENPGKILVLEITLSSSAAKISSAAVYFS